MPSLKNAIKKCSQTHLIQADSSHIRQIKQKVLNIGRPDTILQRMAQH